ncbi:glutamate synthase subunit beta [Alkalibacillus haloalkaliphilus]|uniref:Glutamate synthase [NADPH] small chain n=1 Tax=Alkalibacillus haloalkaliphilus TaxID=94136 RepID=A0A511W763_9BACI|nr:glutamate synthase subunit beta [Alkalibacillus haloalkaliphilus]GEN46581.1 glutamate synthase [NADPH] small chain [Alkalibacillus haloalkaliphilus]
MGYLRGFMEFSRKDQETRDPIERIKDWEEYTIRLDDKDLKQQAARCMDCGTPFCHTGINFDQSDIGCPVNNFIPEWNELVSEGDWKHALERLEETNNFPEFTGRVCPAPCEGSCTLAINDDPVAIKTIENEIIERGFDEGWVEANPPQHRTGQHVAVIGSGPAGLAAADQLNQQGHYVTVYERDDRPGGLLMYGIPNMKLEKDTIDRRVNLLKEEGIMFECNTEVGKDITREELKQQYDAVILCTGAQEHRDVPAENRDSKGIHFAMDYLTESTKALKTDPDQAPIHARGKNVIVIGGGDTGADCVATALRQECNRVVQFGKHPASPEDREEDNPWPLFPMTFKLDYGYKESLEANEEDPRKYEILTQAFESDADGNVKSLRTVRVEKVMEDGKLVTKEIPNSEEIWEADLVLVAIGFTGPEREVLEHFGLELDERGRIWTVDGTKDYSTSEAGVFAAGDARRGQSLVVWAIREGREVAEQVGQFLQTEETVDLV